MYSFTSREIAQALVKAKKRQVNITVILDNGQMKDSYSKSRYLISKGLTVKFHMGQGILHDKFAVIDERVVLTGSYNWSASANKKNAENLLIIRDKKLAKEFTKEFHLLLSRSGVGQLKELRHSVPSKEHSD